MNTKEIFFGFLEEKTIFKEIKSEKNLENYFSDLPIIPFPKTGFF